MFSFRWFPRRESAQEGILPARRVPRCSLFRADAGRCESPERAARPRRYPVAVHPSSSVTAAVVRRALLAVLALAVLFGLAGMHEVISAPSATDSAIAAHVEHVISHDQATMAGPSDAIVHAASVALGPLMGDMAHAMETCCVALVVALALAVLAAPGVLGRLAALRPRAQLARTDSPRPFHGAALTLTLGVLRI